MCNEGEDLDGELSNEGNVVTSEDGSDVLCLDVSDLVLVMMMMINLTLNGDENIVVHHAVMLTVEMLSCNTYPVILLQ